MSIRGDYIITALVLLCSITTTGVVLHREIAAPPTVIAPTEQPTTYVKDWRSGLSVGVSLGSKNAPVQLMEFADFECPYCAEYRKTLNFLRLRYPTQVSLTYIYFPLPGHRFAIPAARVADCASQQGVFEAMHDRLYDEQDAFGLRPWVEFAADAKVPDVPKFERCIEETDPIPKVVRGRQLGNDLDVRATPTLIVNGWKLGRPPSAQELQKMVEAVLAGKEPVPGKTQS